MRVNRKGDKLQWSCSITDVVTVFGDGPGFPHRTLFLQIFIVFQYYNSHYSLVLEVLRRKHKNNLLLKLYYKPNVCKTLCEKQFANDFNESLMSFSSYCFLSLGSRFWVDDDITLFSNENNTCCLKYIYYSSLAVLFPALPVTITLAGVLLLHRSIYDNARVTSSPRVVYGTRIFGIFKTHV